MTIEIKHKITHKVLFTYPKDTLMGANLEGANLERAYLEGANLVGANLVGANLVGADLMRAYLEGANLVGANLEGAYLEGANLVGANLEGANLERANLEGAYLRRANLEEADLRRANLMRAYLVGANLTNTKSLSSFIITPTEGSFIGWKKLNQEVIAKLQITKAAQRVNAYSSRKCRASKVKVLELFGATEATDKHSGTIIYKKGAIIHPDSFNPDPRIECTNGIHFFITRQEAEDY